MSGYHPGEQLPGNTVDIQAAGSIDIHAGSLLASDVVVLTAAGAGAGRFVPEIGTLVANNVTLSGAVNPLGFIAQMQFTSKADVLSGAYQAPGNDCTITAGSLHDLISFTNGAVGGADTIQDFLPGQDHIALSGFGLCVVATVLQGAATTPAGTAFTLPNGTSITVAGVDHLRSADFFSD